MAKRHKLNLYEVQGDEGEQALQINGRLLRGKDAERVYTAVDDAVAKIARVAAEISDPVRPWTSEGAAGLDRTSYEEFVLSITSDADTRALLMLGSESDNGVPASRTSLLGYLAMVKGGGLAKYYTDSEIFACTEGNDALASRLAEGLGDRVRLSEAVTRVDLERGAVWTASGKRYPETGSASCVVLAIPSTRWGEIEFEPGLPGGLTPQMGRNMKVMTVSRTRPWKAAGVRSEVMGEKRVTTTWIGAATESEVALTLFSGGRHAGELASLPGGDRIPTALSDASELMPGLSAASERAAVYDWINDPRTRGSYHFPAPGEVTAMGPTLVNGFEGGRVGLRFAGEGMSYAFMGYMEGALSSGIRTARELITSKGLAGMHS
jgi:monoamine oxidase